MDMVEIVAGALVAIVTSAATAYVTIWLKSRAERIRWEREVAVKHAALRMSDPKAAVRLATDLGRGAIAVVFADGRRDKFPVPNMGTLLIGRSPECDICLEDEDVSKLHARIHSENGCIYLEDILSAQGVIVNGRRVDQRARLGNGDTFVIGSATFELMIW